MVRNILSIITICVFLLVGCGGGSGSNDDSVAQPSADPGEGSNTNNTMILTGVFIDSAVEGIAYTTETKSGTTNASGEFEFSLGEQITFSIGATQLPPVVAGTVLSPMDLAASSIDPAATTTNIARLLQSLDNDGNPDNGITIASDAVENSAAINFDAAVDDFANDAQVINMVANSGSTNMSLVAADDANAHLSQSLSDIEQSIVRPVITGHTLSDDNFALTVMFSVDMKEYFLTQGEYLPSRTYWENPKTFIVEFQSVQPGGSIRLIPEHFVSVSNQTMAEGLEVVFDNDIETDGTADGGATTVSQPAITSHSLSDDNRQLTVMFSEDMTPEFRTEGEYIPSRSYWPNPRTFIVEFESVQIGGSIRLIPEFFISVAGEALAEGLEVTF